MSRDRSSSLFRRNMPHTAAYAGENGWKFDGQSGKSFCLVKGKFRYYMSITPSDKNADKQVLRHLKHYDETGDVHGRTEETCP